MKSKMTKHHCPPRHPNHPTNEERFILKKSEKEHRAYHVIFGNSSSLQECIDILTKYWWTNPHSQNKTP